MLKIDTKKKKNGAFSMGWCFFNGVVPFQWGGAFPMGWCLSNGVVPFQWGGAFPMGWCLSNGVVPFQWGGAFPMGWCLSNGPGCPDYVGQCVLISGCPLEIPFSLHHQNQNCVYIVKICFFVR